MLVLLALIVLLGMIIAPFQLSHGDAPTVIFVAASTPDSSSFEGVRRSSSSRRRKPPTLSPTLAPTLSSAEEDADDSSLEESLLKATAMTKDVAADADNDDNLITNNPNYLDREGDSEAEGVRDDHDKEEKKKSKFAVARALNPRREKSFSRRAARFVKKHKFELILLATIYAFRWEILNLLWRSMTVPVVDPKTGQEWKRVFLWTPTSILKIVLFGMLVWKLQQMNNGDSISPSTIVLMGRLTGNINLAMLLSTLMTPSNPAYLPPVKQHYTFETINNRYNKDHLALSKATQDGQVISAVQLSLHNTTLNATNALELAEQLVAGIAKNTLKTHSLQYQHYNSTVIVLDWTHLDSSLSRMDDMRDEVSFLIAEFHKMSSSSPLSPLSPAFELVIFLQSPGGSAADYALAAQHLLRLRRAGVHVTCCVDKVAASGGYMIGCCANLLCAAPFAVLGSIGVYSESVNVYKLLEGWGVQPLTFRGGRGKAPLSLIGEVTKDGMRKVQDMIDNTHTAFKRHVVESRPMLSDRIDEIATGDVWLGYDALENGLIDRIVTSDEYIFERMKSGARVLKLCKLVRQGLFSRPSTSGATQTAAKTKLHDQRSLLSLLEDFRSLLDRATGTLSSVMGKDRFDFSALASMAGNDQLQARGILTESAQSIPE